MGLDEDVMIVVTGEFGRMPRGNIRPGNRDAAELGPRSLGERDVDSLISGGGKTMSQVIGVDSPEGREYPVERQLTW